MNKKIAIILLAMCIVLAMAGLVACNENLPPIPTCQTHIDRDKNGVCDICSATVTLCEDHVDANSDNLCDNCGETLPKQITPCDIHADADVNGICDICNVELSLLTTVVTATQQSIVAAKSQLAILDFCSYFSITVDGTPVSVSSKMLNLEQLPTTVGTGKVVCSYNGVEAVLQVEVKEFVRYTVTAKVNSLSIEDEQLSDYDFTALFVAQADSAIVLITEDMISLSNDLQSGKSGVVTCTYQGKTAQVEVTVIPTDYQLELSVEQLTLNYNAVNGLDLSTYFVATRNGIKQQITSDMVTTDIQEAVGSYHYTVTYHGITKTLNVVLNDQHNVQILTAYPNGYNLQQTDISAFDVTTMFSIYVDGVAVQVTADMISGTIANTNIGESNSLTCTYQAGDTTQSATATVTIVDTVLPIITSQNIQIYSTQSDFDLTTLFTITLEGQNVPVTLDMLTVPDNILTSGTHNVTIFYKGQSATATVTVIRGVTIQLTRGDYINIGIDTNILEYDFAKDFAVTINGSNFTNINSYIDISNVDFSTEGEYDVTLTIPYGGVNYSETITYNVVKTQNKITVLQPHVVLTTTQSYNVFNNVKIITQFPWGEGEVKLTSNPDYATINTYYAVATAIDYNSIAVQTITVDIYVNGANSIPTQVTFTLQISSTVVVKPVEKVIFEGETVHPSELFQITVDGVLVEAPLQNITGKIDCFHAGTYVVTLDYQGYVVSSRAIVYDDAIKGTYKTLLRTIATDSDTDEYGDVITDGADSRPIGDLIFHDDGTITMDGLTVQLLSAVDSNTMMVKIGTNNYTLHYADGIIVLDPDNSLRMQFTNEKRPLIYFNEAVWQLENNVTIDYSPTYYVLQSEYSATYSVDTFHIQRIGTDTSMWYGLKVRLVERSTSGSTYEVTWGQTIFADNFEQVLGNQSSFTLNGEFYPIKMTGVKAGVIDKDVTDTSYYGAYTGTIDGKQAVLVVNSYYSLTVNNIRWVNLTETDIDNGYDYVGYDKTTQVVTIFNHDTSDGDVFFACQLKVDLSTKTFTLLPPQDNMIGLYTCDNMQIFLDGYGKGIVNYDKSSYYNYPITYTVVGNTLTYTHDEYNSLFPYGKEATFTLSELGNTLKVKSFDGLDIVGKTFVNQFIVSGAVVTYSEPIIYCSTEDEGKTALYEMFNVITKTGELTLDAKKDLAWSSWGVNTYCFDISAINFPKDGFYQFTINLTLDGNKTTSYYTVQIVRPKQTAQNYGAGIVNHNYTFAVDAFGIAKLNISGNVYSGEIKLDEQNNIFGNLKHGNSYVLVKSRPFAEGIMELIVSGDASFNEYFVIGSTTVIGTHGLTLRKVTVGGQDLFLLSTSEASTSLKIVQVNVVSGASITATNAILQIVDGQNSTYIKVNAWGDVSNGCTLADVFRGTHTNDSLGILVVDGFGKVTLTADSQTKYGTYQINSAKEIMAQFGNDFCVYTIDNGVFEVYNITLNNSLVEGSTYIYQGVGDSSAEGESSSWESTYNFETSFTFGANGIVTIDSTLILEEDETATLQYAPTYVGVGSYSVKGNVVTVTIGENTFLFQIDKVIYAKQLICTSTTLSESDHGYFKVDATFSKSND